MKVVQIIGPSYSGSTVLGYILNTKKNWFFGSEVYRLLDDHLSAPGKKGKPNPQCDFCGETCEFWNSSLKNLVLENKTNSLDDVYRWFSERNPDQEVFVDGSKSLRWFSGNEKDYQIVTAKHPVRLLASFLYNERKKSGYNEESIEGFGRYVDDNVDWFFKRSVLVLRRVVNNYKEVFEKFPDAFVCKMDELHCDEFLEMRKLEQYLNVEEKSFDVFNFSQYEVHPLGGNRAPYWQAMHSKGKKESFGERDSYYNNAESFGDYKIDNKFFHIVTKSLGERVGKSSEYQELSDILGYETTFPSE
ncbi:hypothetical protein QC589_02320 [Halomonas elongata]|uniref:hypothetical protein n=1 Tax=Halomonas elongata TaxID=2746 RepID=UPI00335B4CC1